MDRVLAAVRAALLAADGEEDSGVEVDDQPDLGGVTQKRRDVARASQLATALERFDAAMVGAIAQRPNTNALRGLLVIWLEVGLHMRLRRQAANDEGRTFATQWLTRATETCGAESRIDALEQHVVSLAAACDALDADSTQRNTARAAHEKLERFYSDGVPHDRARSALLPDEARGLVLRLLGDGGADLESGLAAVLATETQRSIVVRAVDDPSAPLSIFDTPRGKLLRQRLRRSRGQVVEHEGDLCAIRRTPMTVDDLRQLRRDRYVICARCDRVHVRRKP
jgi:hypothetical protein